MSHIWTQSITINKDLVKKLIESQTALKVSSIDDLGEGWDNVAYLINKEFVFRFPRRQMGIDCMKNEIDLTPYISTKVSFPFSYPQYIGKPTDLYDAPFAGYKVLPGIPLSNFDAELIDDLNFAKILALWLKELHFVPIIPAHILKVKGDQSWRYDVRSRLNKSKNTILQYQSFFIDAGFDIQELLKGLERLHSFESVIVEKKSYIHGDLYSKHLLINKERDLSGIIDWGDVHIGNPGTDLAIGFMIFSDNALKTFFSTYGPITTEIKNVAIIRAFCHPIALLPYCYDKNEETLKKWTILALKRVVVMLSNYREK